MNDMTTGFEWKRFWCARGGSINLSDGGYLADPESAWGKYLNADLIPLERMSDLDCVALLGEPGIGKSWELEKQCRELAPNVVANGGRLLRVDLRSFKDEGRLMRTLFESEEFREWRDGNYLLHLFLDSLDECLIRMDNVAALLAEELPKQPAGRLRLRIACRTAPWPGILEHALTELFPGFQAYEMAPLRRVDVRNAAERSGIGDPDVFLERVQELDATALAIKPVTLKFLVSTYLRDGEFPTDQIALYEKGCRLLCEEQNPSRIGAGRAGRLSPEERLAVAARIAALTQFANRDAVYTGTESDGVLPEDVSVAEIAGGAERGPSEIAVTRDAIREVLDTGLFSSRGRDRLGWAHQTYAEFLAALYCKRHDLAVEQIQSLLFHPVEESRNLVPQLRELAAWSSALNPEIFKAIGDAEPETLLGSGAANLSDPQRKVLANAILDQCANGRSFHLRWEMYASYPKLKYDGLSDQLRPYLREKTHPLEVRIVAADIVRICALGDLGSELAEVALDRDEAASLRTVCAVAVAEFGPPVCKGRLRTLALGEGGDDPDDELKGAALKALWPEQISVQEILPLLTIPKQSDLSGAYSSFLDHCFVEKMRISDIPSALEWFSRQDHRARFGAIDRVMDGIVELAWKHLDEPEVVPKFAEAVLSRMRLYDSLVSGVDRTFAAKVQEDQERRRKLLGELLPRLGAEGAPHLITFDVPLLAPSDFEWLIDRVLSSASPASLEMEAKLIFQVFDERNRASIERLWFACSENEILKREYGAFFEPIALDSPQAQLLRDRLAQQKAWKQPKLLDPPPSERIMTRLSRIESGQTEEWLWLVCDLTLEPTSQHTTLPGPNLTVLPGWVAAEETVRERIVSAAVRYVNDCEPDNETWIGTAAMPGVAITGYHALSLLLIVAEERLNTLEPTAWRKWLPTLVRYGTMEKDELQLGSRLLKRAYVVAPAEAIMWIERIIDSENERTGYFFASTEIETCWDRQMGEALLQKVADPKLKPPTLAGLCALLSRHEVSGWREQAESFIDESALESEIQRSRMRGAIEALLMNASDAGWARVWPILSTHKDFGRQVMESLSYGRPGGVDFVKNLTEQQLGELYVWMVENYPIVERRTLSGAMSSVDTAVMFRDSVLEHLKRRGSFAACEAIGRIMEALPQHGWLERQLEEAKVLARAATWEPISPGQFLAMALDSDRRFVETPKQLMEVLLGSLARLQFRLHDELPAVKDLWNGSAGTFWPKDEQDLSIYVARHLRDDLNGRGVIVNREVQIRRGSGDGTGQSTDIHVDATVPGRTAGTYERTYVIIEVKGNWHRELRSAMQTQLRDRYLKNNACKNGIYLVGWFSCEGWRETDPREKQCPKITLPEAAEEFRQQAASLSKDGYLIRAFVLDVSLS
jgi:hypothetical protein